MIANISEREPRTPRATLVRSTALCLLAFALTGCDWLDRALDVQAPELIPSTNMDDPQQAGLLVAGALADFDCAYGSYIVITGEMSDELTNASELANRWPYDRRDVQPSDIRYATFNCQSLGVYVPVSTARFTTDDTLEKLEAWSDADVPNRTSLIAEMAAYSGYSHILLGEGFCSAAIDLGPELSQAQVFERAEPRFTRAIAAAEASGRTDLLNMALVGRARVRRNLGNLTGAADDARRVTDGFAVYAEASSASSRRQNRIFIHNRQPSIDVTVAEASRGLTFGGVPDPRVEVIEGDRNAADGLVAWYQTKYTSDSSPMRIASWEEAQLIIAEVEAEIGDPQAAVAIINELHRRVGLPVFGSTDVEEIRAQVIEERRRELFLEGQRLYDIHRKGIEFGPAPGTPYRRAGVYGSATCLPLPDIERANNPNIP
jgi:starch-binding outer membrane protein, SusD/RagB family